MNKDDFINDLGTAIMKLRASLESRNITPVSIDLASWEDGQRLLGSLDQEHMLYVEQGIDNRTGEMVNQAQVAGMIIRWPTMRKARFSRKGFDYI